MKLTFDEKRCTACGLCELACSFHHLKSFLPDRASIHIDTDRKGRIELTTLPTCDLCKSENGPLCAEFCPTEAIQWKNQSSNNGLKTSRNQLDNQVTK